MNDLMQAISERHSSRKYLDTPLEELNLQYLNGLIKDFNKKFGLCMQLILNDERAFQGFTKSYGIFQGVEHYLALVGKTNDPFLLEKCGYYGERFVLEATRLGLGTCWVGGTFSKKDCPVAVAADETFVCVIVIGNIADELSFREKFIHRVTHRKTKHLEDFYDSNVKLPDWFKKGIEATKIAPSALNKQPVKFYYLKNETTCSVPKYDSHEAIDMGIAKLHFEIAANNGKWEWGNEALYVLNS